MIVMNVAHASRRASASRRAPAWRLGSALALAAIVVPALAGCGTSNAGSGDGPRVVASFYPLEYVAERVAGGHADVVRLTSPGGDPHDLELTVAQTAEIAEADVMVSLSGFQPAVDEAVEQEGPEHAVDAAEVADLVSPEELGAGDATEHTDEEGEDHGDLDAHFWTDPTRVAAVAAVVKKQLVAVDPDHADAYERNLADLQGDLERLDADIEAGLESCARDVVVVSHDAFGYFGDRYGLDMHAINGLSPDAEPSPAHLRELADLIEEEGVTTVFSESIASPEMAETLAAEVDLDTAVLDPIEGLTDETADEDYVSLMRNNLAAIQKANDCT
jgi:zinc transport system substrate-binding protein